MSNNISTQVKCSDCGKIATVPFKPQADKPVYCRECLAKHRTPRRETGNRTQVRPQTADTEKQAWSRRRERWQQ